MKRGEGNVILMRFSALGDVAMTLPAAYSVALTYPDRDFIFLTRPFFANLFVNPPENLKTYPIDISKVKTPAGYLRLFREIGQLNPSAIADLHNVSRTWMIDSWFRLRGIRVAMVDKMRSQRKSCISDKRQQTSFIERYRDTIAEAGFPFDYCFPGLFPQGVESPIPLAKPAVGVAPFARYEDKIYPLKLMRQAVALLAEKGIAVYLFGGRGKEQETLERWSREIEGCESVVGKLTLQQELALMANLDAMVSMDSANQHLAALCGIPVITLWGSTTPLCGFGAWSQPAANSIVAGTECQPCSIAGGKGCKYGDYRCFRAITPERVAQTVIKIIGTR